MMGISHHIRFTKTDTFRNGNHICICSYLYLTYPVILRCHGQFVKTFIPDGTKKDLPAARRRGLFLTNHIWQKE